jgi:hypothetical protein
MTTKIMKISVIFDGGFMAKAILLIVSMLFGAVSYADIQGKWEIDVDLTIEFNKVHYQTDRLETQLLKCFSASSYWKIGKENFLFVTKKNTCYFGDNATSIDEFYLEYKYKKIFENDDVLILSNNNKEDNSEFIEVIHWANKNLIWMYYPGEKPEYNSHVRYYYKKVLSGD